MADRRGGHDPRFGGSRAPEVKAVPPDTEGRRPPPQGSPLLRLLSFVAGFAILLVLALGTAAENDAGVPGAIGLAIGYLVLGYFFRWLAVRKSGKRVWGPAVVWIAVGVAFFAAIPRITDAASDAVDNEAVGQPSASPSDSPFSGLKDSEESPDATKAFPPLDGYEYAPVPRRVAARQEAAFDDIDAQASSFATTVITRGEATVGFASAVTFEDEVDLDEEYREDFITGALAEARPAGQLHTDSGTFPLARYRGFYATVFFNDDEVGMFVVSPNKTILEDLLSQLLR